MKTKFTKTIILMAAITFGLFTAAEAQTAYDDQYYNDQQNTYNQPQQYYAQPAPVPDQQSFYYYPDANVYYDLSCNRYIYNNGYAWISVNVLPQGFFLGNAPRVMIYHNGPRVWMDNAMHINTYRRVYRGPAVAFNARAGFDNRQDFRHFDGRGSGGRGFEGGDRGGFREAHYRR